MFGVFFIRAIGCKSSVKLTGLFIVVKVCYLMLKLVLILLKFLPVQFCVYIFVCLCACVRACVCVCVCVRVRVRVCACVCLSIIFMYTWYLTLNLNAPIYDLHRTENYKLVEETQRNIRNTRFISKQTPHRSSVSGSCVRSMSQARGCRHVQDVRTYWPRDDNPGLMPGRATEINLPNNLIKLWTCLCLPPRFISVFHADQNECSISNSIMYLVYPWIWQV